MTYISQGLLRNLLSWSIPLILWCRFKDIEMLRERTTNFQDTRHVSATITIIWGGPNGRETIIVEDGETFHTELMCTQDMYHGIDFEELLDDLSTECVTSSSIYQKGFASESSVFGSFQELRVQCNSYNSYRSKGESNKTQHTLVISQILLCPDQDPTKLNQPSALHGEFL
jgi:hypothetical protein